VQIGRCRKLRRNCAAEGIVRKVRVSKSSDYKDTNWKWPGEAIVRHIEEVKLFVFIKDVWESTREIIVVEE
jgi:hypothetical protein